MDYRVVLITAPGVEQGRTLARRLLAERLAACVNIVPQVESHYWWQGELQQDAEVMLVVKTTGDLLDRLLAEVRAHHPYDVPEVIALPITEGNPAYLSWISESVRKYV